MNRRVVGIVVATALASLLFAAVTTSGGVQMWDDPQWESTQSDPRPVAIEAEATEAEPPELPENSDGSPVEVPDWLLTMLGVVLVLAASAGTATLAVVGWRNRPHLRWRRRAADASFEVLPDVATAVIDEAAAQRSELLNGEPRNAIVRCWLRLEDDVAAAGLRRHPADTSAEFTERVLARYSVDSQAIRDLASLYREARFSRHPLDESTRAAALGALERLHQALIAGTSESADHAVGVAT